MFSGARTYRIADSVLYLVSTSVGSRYSVYHKEKRAGLLVSTEVPPHFSPETLFKGGPRAKSSLLPLLAPCPLHFFQALASETHIPFPAYCGLPFRLCCFAFMSLNTMLLRKPMLPLLPRAAARACLLSSGQTQTQTFPVGQGGRLVVDMAKAAAVVKVTAQWIDSCSLTISRLPAGTDPDCCDVEGLRAMKKVQHLSSLDAAGLTLQADETLAQLTLAHDQERAGADWEGTYLVEAVVPELFSLNVSVSHGNVSVSNKLKGDCQIQLDRGDIGVGTVRGETIRLSTGRGHVKVNELEGNVDIQATADVSHKGKNEVLQSCRRVDRPRGGHARRGTPIILISVGNGTAVCTRTVFLLEIGVKSSPPLR